MCYYESPANTRRRNLRSLISRVTEQPTQLSALLFEFIQVPLRLQALAVSVAAGCRHINQPDSVLSNLIDIAFPDKTE